MARVGQVAKYIMSSVVTYVGIHDMYGRRVLLSIRSSESIFSIMTLIS